MQNRSRDRHWIAVVRKRNAEFVLDFLRSHPCEHCGEGDPIVLEFDHKNPAEKTMPIAKMLCGTWSIRRLKAEIDKCRVLCANCHRRWTAQQQKWKWKLGVL